VLPLLPQPSANIETVTLINLRSMVSSVPSAGGAGGGCDGHFTIVVTAVTITGSSQRVLTRVR
jgi:hypothetical protein